MEQQAAHFGGSSAEDPVGSSQESVQLARRRKTEHEIDIQTAAKSKSDSNN